MEIFKTVSFHLVKPCNMGCKFCYATYNSFNVGRQLHFDEVAIILEKLRNAGVKKVTFAGGEPMLYKNLPQVIYHAKYLGLTTSIITNGSRLTWEWLNRMNGILDWIGISIDSLDSETNQAIGRVTKKGEVMDYFKLVDMINAPQFNYKLKINTVVNRFNEHENMYDFIDYSKTRRWKVFDTLRVVGQNETQYNAIKSTDFEGFVIRNAHDSMVVETNDLMTGSYLLIDPKGRFYENWGEETTKSKSLITHSVEECLSQITLNKEKFLERGGIYEW